MNTITLSKAEAIILHDILVNLHVELSPMIGQDMTAVLDSEEDAATVAASAAEFNYDEIEVVDEDGDYNLFSAVNHFLERLETGGTK